ncbi:hypothetical protein [Halarcobacter anaerophilus]|uniref:UDP-2,4-diacetamido-2,4, 6-trideoxy-beta-L-altropyranose hydrolase n=1 Tax=Halarcobacter anaerophilus TaxID=877500 RepID=A0A4Q0XZH4_9BACT|nr:hypothetical protein [Halarcobacter anaerophilus]QDF30237.1 UDP-2,4-diacetamido-2,4,6-trideoxy-beta-L-altropyranosyl transferase [Halarcobacter anaerophilus]RXJ62204.1 hypothetical protein CRV06_10585 [Halarcobacter anaerophilus]
MQKKVLIRCDASKDIGLGHITRCLVLANHFRDEGYKVFFAIKDYGIAKEKLIEQKFDILLANEKEFDYFNWIKNIVEQKKINLFIGDIRDGFPIDLITYMKNKNILTIAIDEPSEYAKECALCFYPPHANIDESLYKGKVYKGLEYVILRPEFYKEFEKKKNNIPNILVMMGGTDTFNLTLPIIKQIDKNDKKFEISVILSDKHKDINQLNKFVETSKHQIKVYNEVKDMSSFLNKIDFAISLFGSVAYEYLIKNIPSIYIQHEKEISTTHNYFINNNYAIVNDMENINIDKLFILFFQLRFKCKIFELIKEVNNGN